MKEKHKKLVIGWIILWSVIYLISTFIALDPNPINFDTVGRSVFSICILASAIVYYGIWDGKYN